MIHKESYPGTMKSDHITCSCERCELKETFFINMKQEDLGSFCGRKIETLYVRGESIYREGEPIHVFSYLKSGLVKLFQTDEEGNEQIVTIAGPLDFVSLLGVFSDTHHSFGVTALDDSVICSIDIRLMRDIAQNNARFTLTLMEKLNVVSNKIIQEGMEIRKRNASGKLAYILIKFCDALSPGPVFELPLTRREIAEYIGMSTENVIRTLSGFRKERLIRINGHEIELLDRKALERISSFG